jgi:hypothetical protein
MAQVFPKMAQVFPKWPRVFQNGPGFSRMAQSFPKWTGRRQMKDNYLPVNRLLQEELGGKE